MNHCFTKLWFYYLDIIMKQYFIIVAVEASPPCFIGGLGCFGDGNQKSRKKKNPVDIGVSPLA